MSQNADTVDAGEGGGISDKMLTLITLGNSWVGKSGHRA